MTDHEHKQSAKGLEVQNAVRAGWRSPKVVAPLRTWCCSGGCGRTVTHGSTDPTCGYTCPYCSDSIRAFNAATTAAKKKAKAGAL